VRAQAGIEVVLGIRIERDLDRVQRRRTVITRDQLRSNDDAVIALDDFDRERTEGDRLRTVRVVDERVATYALTARKIDAACEDPAEIVVALQRE
jgi:hypothetical protein